jgi:hypothetical protein
MTFTFWEDSQKNRRHKELMETLGKLAKPEQRASAPKIVWKGHLYELADLIIREHGKGTIEAKSMMKALEMVARHFTTSKSKDLTARSLFQNWKRAKEDGNLPKPRTS